MEDSIFTKIIKGEIPSFKVYEDDAYCAFLDILPLNLGQMVLVPKKQVESIFDLDNETYHGLFDVVKKLAGPLQRATGCMRVGFIVEGFEVPHTHVKIVPLFGGHDIDPDRRFEASKEELKAMQGKILAELNK